MVNCKGNDENLLCKWRDRFLHKDRRHERVKRRGCEIDLVKLCIQCFGYFTEIHVSQMELLVFWQRVFLKPDWRFFRIFRWNFKNYVESNSFISIENGLVDNGNQSRYFWRFPGAPPGLPPGPSGEADTATLSPPRSLATFHTPTIYAKAFDLCF